MTPRSPRGVNTDALDREKEWDFTPGDLKVRQCSSALSLARERKRLAQEGDHVSGGDIIGYVYENSYITKHAIMVGPRAMGTVTHMADKGSYHIEVR